MAKSNDIKKLAQSVPGLGKILKEKQMLHQDNIRQKEQIERLQLKLSEKSREKKEPLWPLLKTEILKAERLTVKEKPRIGHKPPYKLNWVVPAVSPSSGGQADIFRTIKFLTAKGHDCLIYIFDPAERSDLKEQRQIIKERYPGTGDNVFYNSLNFDDCDAIFATHWLTAYPVRNFGGKGKKYYFAQGYEPHTQAQGYLSYLAESTYSFGFRGVVLGKWLAEKLNGEYKMECEYFDFGYDPDEYFVDNHGSRGAVLFYAQPSKAHRGFELGIPALEIFHKTNPSCKIHLFGEDLSGYNIPFPHVNHGILVVEELNQLYNRCNSGLSLSFTNISLIPLEMIAAGCQPVVNDAYQTRQIKYSKMVSYSRQSPQAIADALSGALRNNPSGLNLKLPEEYSWDHSNLQIEKILTKDLS